MTSWERLPDRFTPDGQRIITERAEIDGEVWFCGNMPQMTETARRNWFWRTMNRLWRSC